MITQLTQNYWVKVLTEWAEQRLPPPQFDECCAVLGQLAALRAELDAAVKRAERAEYELYKARSRAQKKAKQSRAATPRGGNVTGGADRASGGRRCAAAL